MAQTRNPEPDAAEETAPEPPQPSLLDQILESTFARLSKDENFDEPLLGELRQLAGGPGLARTPEVVKRLTPRAGEVEHEAT